MLRDTLGSSHAFQMRLRSIWGRLPLQDVPIKQLDPYFDQRWHRLSKESQVWIFNMQNACTHATV